MWSAVSSCELVWINKNKKYEPMYKILINVVLNNRCTYLERCAGGVEDVGRESEGGVDTCHGVGDETLFH